MTAFVANEMAAFKRAGMIIKHSGKTKEVSNVLLSGAGRRAGYEGTGSDIKGDER